MCGETNPAIADTPQVLLEHHLKQLRLPTFLREYDKVARQCAAESVDYPRYLLRLTGTGTAGPRTAGHRTPHSASTFSGGQEPGHLRVPGYPGGQQGAGAGVGTLPVLAAARERVVAGQQWYRENASRAGPRDYRPANTAIVCVSPRRRRWCTSCWKPAMRNGLLLAVRSRWPATNC